MTIIQVTSAVKLSEKQCEKLLQGFQKKYSKVELKETVDPSVLGGLKVTVGSVQYDATLRHKLTQLENAVTGE